MTFQSVQHPNLWFRGIRKRLLAACVGLLLSAIPAMAQGLEFSGNIGAELRSFTDTPSFQGQSNKLQFSGFFEPELKWQNDARTSKLALTLFGRVDSVDDERTHFDIREAYYRHVAGDWDFLVGVNQVFWGVTESRHLVNIINQIDALEDIDEETFLGQPMIQIGRQTDFGRFELFMMSGFRERKFSGADGRLRFPVPVNPDGATYESRHEERRPEVALRYTHYIGEVDIGLHYFNGNSREPTLTLAPGGQSLNSFYPEISQFGMDLQYTSDAWLWKFEGIFREGQGESFTALVAGLEYTVFQIGGSSSDLGLIAEALYDGRDDTVFPTLFDQDIFLGARLALNDTQDTSVLAGLVTDVETGPASFRIEAERRIGQSWSASLNVQLFMENDLPVTTFPFQNDSYVNFELTKHF